MANEEQLSILKQGVEAWNKWRYENIHKVNIDLSEADLRDTHLAKVFFYGANLFKTKLSGANLDSAILNNANLTEANLIGVSARDADFGEANLSEARLDMSELSNAKFGKANLYLAKFIGSILKFADFVGAYSSPSDLSYADLSGAKLSGVDLSSTGLIGANLEYADLEQTYLNFAYLSGANLKGAFLLGARIIEADLSKADLTGANLRYAILGKTSLSDAILQGALLEGASLIGTAVDGAIISQANIYGVSVWDLKGEFKDQRDLVITPYGEPAITVDNIKVAQFIYLILNNSEIRDVINTLTSKSVLILGRFADDKRKAVLDALRNKLRDYNLLPIVFDFDRPIDRNITETIKTLAGISYFVIADVTSPRSSPLELQAIVPDFQIPVVPIIQHGELPFSMINDLRTQHSGLLDPLTYDSEETLIKVLKSAIIDPAIEKHNELRLIKAQKPRIRSARDFLEKEME